MADLDCSGMTDYRMSPEEAARLSSREVIEKVLFSIAKDSPPYWDDLAMGIFLQGVNPVVAAIFSAWMASGFIANGGPFDVYESCSFPMITPAAHGFRLLGKDDVAYAIELSFRAFPGGIVPASHDERLQRLEEFSERFDSCEETAADETISALQYRYNKAEAYDRTDDVLDRFRAEFVEI